MKKSYKIGSKQRVKKDISKSLVSEIEKIRRNMQTELVIKFGRKAPRISFVYASKELAKRLRGSLK